MSELKKAVEYAVAACYEPWLLGALGDLFTKAKDALTIDNKAGLLVVAQEFSERGEQIRVADDGRGVYSPRFYKKDVGFGMAILLRGYANGDEQEAKGAGGFFSCAAGYYVSSAMENSAIPQVAAAWAQRDTAPVWLDRLAKMLE